MTFEEALPVLKQGGKVRRSGWDDLNRDWTVEIASPVLPDGRRVSPLLLCKAGDGLLGLFTGGPWDLLAEDWVIVP